MLLLAVVGCSHPEAAPQPAPAAVEPGPMPRTIGEFALVDTSTFDFPNGGIMYRYRDSAGFQPDVFRYPVTSGTGPCTGACLSDASAHEVATYRHSVPEQVRRGYIDSVQLVSDEAIVPERGSWLTPGRHARFRLFRDGKQYESHFVIVAGQELFLKVRATFLPGSVTPEHLHKFISQLLASAPPDYRCPDGPSASAGMTMSTALLAASHDLPPRIDSALADEGYALEYRSVDETDGRWRTAPRFSWPPDSPGASLAGESKAGLMLYVASQVRGDSVYFQVDAQSLCATGGKAGPENDPGGTLEALAVIELTAAATTDSSKSVR